VHVGSKEIAECLFLVAGIGLRVDCSHKSLSLTGITQLQERAESSLVSISAALAGVSSLPNLDARSLAGGEIREYVEMMQHTRDEALCRLVEPLKQSVLTA